MDIHLEDGIPDGYNWTEWSGNWVYINGQFGIKDNKLILYAIWNKIEKYTIIYMPNGGEGKMESNIYSLNEYCIIKQNSFIKSG